MKHDLAHPARTYILCFAIPAGLALSIFSIALVLYGLSSRTQSIADALIASTLALGLASLVIVADTKGHIGTTASTLNQSWQRTLVSVLRSVTLIASITAVAPVPAALLAGFVSSTEWVTWWSGTVIILVGTASASLVFSWFATASLRREQTRQLAQRPDSLVYS